jgi:hypothetical protein
MRHAPNDIYPPENTARLTHPSSDLFSHKYNDAIDFDLRNVITGIALNIDDSWKARGRPTRPTPC